MKMEWQPIETAPRDGTHILVATEGTIGLVWWEDYAVELYDGVGWRDHGDMGWGGMIGAEPTHWMPLPDPPSS